MPQERVTRKTFMGDYALEEQDQKSLNRAINLAGELEDLLARHNCENVEELEQLIK